MSSDAIISARSLGKSYPAWDHPFKRLLHRLTPGLSGHIREFTALRDISFDIGRGETIGIIGHNGSGKSTLLQLICGIRRPTTGEVVVKGRISALLELGAGFHPEFTGRENAFLQGAIQGFSQAEIEARFEDIAAFADIGDYLDQPVKTYSSGMFVRLAFAVAISLEPEILVVDEALSVGDEAFQRKCFARIHAIHENGGTILFVSHSTPAIVELCNRVMLLDHGELAAFGEPKKVVALYHKLIYAPANMRDAIRAEIRASRTHPEREPSLPLDPHDKEGQASFDASLVSESRLPYPPQGATIFEPELHTLEGERVNILSGNREYLLSFGVRFTEDAYHVRMGTMIKTKSGFELGGRLSAPAEDGIPHVAKGTTLRISLRFRCLLREGTYFINCGVVGIKDGAEQFLHRIVDAVAFRVTSEYDGTGTGIVDFAPLSGPASEIIPQ